jgi:hypothetical protein
MGFKPPPRAKNYNAPRNPSLKKRPRRIRRSFWRKVWDWIDGDYDPFRTWG